MRTFLLFVAAVLLATSGFGQYTRLQYPANDKSPDARSGKIGNRNIVSLHLTQALVREVQVSYERFVLPRLSLEGALGARIPAFNDYEVYTGVFATDYNVN
ncbi:MAG: hypothetical protein ICV83_13825 [Cytophagales bacterium]|nr:hypothetical protein [Cytophagales bacterium]